MKRHLPLLTLALLLGACASAPKPPSTTMTKPALPPEKNELPRIAPIHGPSNPAPGSENQSAARFYGSIIGLDPAKEKLYRELHANVWPEVVAAITKANIRNFTVYLTEIDGRRYLVSTFEYVGSDPAKDFASMAADPVTREKWWPLTDGCQIRLPGTPAGAQWRAMERINHLP
jgi:L-rhamnose mutarotase